MSETTTKYIARYGPAPEATEDNQGKLHAEFTAYVLYESDDQLEEVVGFLWNAGVERGYGHMLVGSYDDIVYRPTDGGQPCGESQWRALQEPDKDSVSLQTRGYVPLFALARTVVKKLVDLAVDYRVVNAADNASETNTSDNDNASETNTSEITNLLEKVEPFVWNEKIE